MVTDKFKSMFRMVILLAAPVFGLAARVGAQCQTLRWTFNNPTPAGFDIFGTSVAISGNAILVGAYSDDTGAADAGSAYLFDSATGALLRTFNNPTPAASDDFGVSVAVSGNDVLIGAWRDDTGAADSGIVYLFHAATGSLLQTFSNPTPEVDDRFGWPVAILGNYVLVGSFYDNTGAIDAGNAYLFNAATGLLVHTFNNPTPEVSDYFGSSVSLSGSAILVGAPYDNTGATWAGSAYLFDAVTGSLLRTINNPTPVAIDNFGQSVAVSGNNVLVGAYNDDAGATNAGSAYLFDAATGVLLRTFNNPTPGIDSHFGESVALSGNHALVGAHLDDTGATDAGSACLFDATTGALLRTFNNPTPAVNDQFGAWVSASGDNVLVGAYGDDTGATDAGSAYLYTCSPNAARNWLQYE